MTLDIKSAIAWQLYVTETGYFMVIKLALFVLLSPLMVIFSLIPCQAQTARDQKWREDLNYMVRELEIRHANPYHTVPRNRFAQAVNRLRVTIPKLTDQQLSVEFARLLARIGDGHTGIFLPWDKQNGFRRYPVEVWPASDGLLILAAPPELSDIVGARIKRIERLSAEEVTKAIEPVLSLDSEYGINSLLTYYIVIPELLHALGCIDNMEQLNLTIEDVQGRARDIKLRPVAKNANIDWRMIKDGDALPLWLRKRNEKYWFTYLPDSKLLYVQFNSADISAGEQETKFEAFCDSLVDFVQTHEIEKCALDLRWNAGGNSMRARHLLRAIIRADKINQRGKLFTIISSQTFSAAVLLAVDLEQQTQTLFVGEPTGGKPNGYGELRRFRLPNSNLEVRYSAWKYQTSSPSDNRPAIMPDLIARLSSSDYRSGIDPALDVILGYKPRQPINAIMLETINGQGLQAAVMRYRELRSKHYNEYDFSEVSLTNPGNELLRSKRLNEAITLFLLNVEAHPYSANAYSSLAEAYMMAGRKELALRNYRKAFELNKANTNALDNIRRLSKPSR